MDRIRTDAAAHTHARQRLADQLTGTRLHIDEDLVELDAYDAPALAEAMVDTFVIVFKCRVNEHGVPVRRVVMYGPEECDPNVPAVEAGAAVA